MIVVLVDPRRPALVPVDAIELLTGPVQYTEEMPIAVPWSLPDAHPAHLGDDAPVLLSSDPNHPAVVARLAAGARLISAPNAQRGERLLDAVAMMDRLRSNGPWESEQTHESLRRYLLEETYELLDAVHSGDVEQLREELGDLLLQVLFHARIAEDAALLPFCIDDVADTLMRKLGSRDLALAIAAPHQPEERRQRASGLHCPTNQTAQYVSAVLVAWHNTVSNEEDCSPDMVNDQADMPILGSQRG